MIENDKEGILVQDGDPYVLAGAIASLANDFGRAKEFAVNAHKRAVTRHNPQRIIGQVLDGYRDILKQSK